MEGTIKKLAFLYCTSLARMLAGYDKKDKRKRKVLPICLLIKLYMKQKYVPATLYQNLWPY